MTSTESLVLAMLLFLAATAMVYVGAAMEYGLGGKWRRMAWLMYATAAVTGFVGCSFVNNSGVFR